MYLYPLEHPGCTDNAQINIDKGNLKVLVDSWISLRGSVARIYIFSHHSVSV